MKKNTFKRIVTVGAVLAGVAVFIASILNKRENENEEYCTPKALRKAAKNQATFYEKYVKRGLDILLSLGGILILWPIMAISALIVYLEDPANPIFQQKRVGINKTYFRIHKLRSMKVNMKDVPTHLLSKEEQDAFILRSGRLFRKLSIDELPQCFDILRGRMSVVGPRPALWNQDDLIAERDKYGANDVKPGLTGWAQINGRDELEIPVKAQLDGYYKEQLRKSSLSGFWMDFKCFFGTFMSVLSSEGVVEGGTGNKEKKNSHQYEYVKKATNQELIGNIGFLAPVKVNWTKKRNVLITGKGSYIGESFESYARENFAFNFKVDTLDMMDESWRTHDFAAYDIVLHVAGIAHADVGQVSEETQRKYYEVNTDLALEVAQKAKQAGVKEFIFMSSMIVYGESAPFGKKRIINKNTVPKPANFYGDSKLQADVAVRKLADADFSVLVLRPPMIYGKDCKGNYPLLAKLAKKLPVFPYVDNARSMLYIENFCEFVCELTLIDQDCFSVDGNVFFPQNALFSNTSDMVKIIAEAVGHKIAVSKVLAPAVALGSIIPGKIGQLINKAFGNSCYDQNLSNYPGMHYQKYNFAQSVRRTESVDLVEHVKNTKEVQKVENEPLVSVITVAFNSEKTIQRTIESVLNQTYTNVEYLIIDGCSTDHTLEIAHSYEGDFARKGMNYHIISEKDAGIYDAMNKGIRKASGEIIGIINSDDWYEVNALKTMVRNFQVTDFDYYYADVCLHKADGSKFIKHSKMDHIVTSRHWNHPTCFVRKAVYDELGTFKNEGIHDDFDFFLRVRKAGKKVVIENQVLANFRTGGASNDKTIKKCLKRCKDRFQCYVSNGYSPLYLIECVGIELAKVILS